MEESVKKESLNEDSQNEDSLKEDCSKQDGRETENGSLRGPETTGNAAGQPAWSCDGDSSGQSNGYAGHTEAYAKGCSLGSPADQIRTAFAIEEKDVRSYSPLTLAFLGDSVYEIVIRTMVVTRANTSPNQLNRQSSALAKAETQAKLAHLLEGELTEEETAVFKRGRNAHSATKAKNATVADYRVATGFEALMGYLYLKGATDRILELLHMGFERLEGNREKKN